LSPKFEEGKKLAENGVGEKGVGNGGIQSLIEKYEQRIRTLSIDFDNFPAKSHTLLIMCTELTILQSVVADLKSLPESTENLQEAYLVPKTEEAEKPEEINLSLDVSLGEATILHYHQQEVSLFGTKNSHGKILVLVNLRGHRLIAQQIYFGKQLHEPGKPKYILPKKA